MKKRTWLLAMLLVCALAFAGCTSQQKPTGEDAQKEDQQEEQLTEEKTEEEQPESPEAGENADQAEDAQQPEEFYRRNCGYILENREEDTPQSFQRRALELFRQILGQN